MSEDRGARGSTPPLFADTMTLCEWLLGRLGNDSRVLPSSICSTALALLDAVVLALKDRARHERVEQADELLILLRAKLRLAGSLAYLSRDQMLYALQGADGIGRQLGGWLKALGPV